MDRSRVILLTAIAFVGGAAAAHAGPCTAQIVEIEQYIERATATGSGPSTAQTVGAQLHHQPTPQSVEDAESKARSASELGLEHARNADAEGDAVACEEALDEVKQLYE